LKHFFRGLYPLAPVKTGRELDMGRERKEGREGKGREGKGRGKGREGKGREGKGREGKGREGSGAPSFQSI
jgi:hypothetical protein